MKAAEHTKFILNICKAKVRTSIEIIFTGPSDMGCQNAWQKHFKWPEKKCVLPAPAMECYRKNNIFL